MRIATFGDIHGNLFALQAVWADLRTQKPDGLLVTGDLVYKFPWGAEVVDLLRSLPCHVILGNAELYLVLWGTSLWPEKWNLPRARELVMWERERLGGERLAWLASLPEHVAFAGGRLEDLVVVHGVPGNPFVPFLARPGEDRSPWVQSDARVRELLAGLDTDMVVCGHTHTTLLRKVDRTLIVNPGAVGYGRGADTGVGRADYALLDWSAAAGWHASFRSVSYDPEPLHRALLALRGDYPVAAYVASRQRPASAASVPDEPLDFVRYRWGDAPDWWEERDELPVWRALRGDGSGP